MTKEDKTNYVLDLLLDTMEEPPCMWLEEQGFSCPYLNKDKSRKCLCTYPTQEYYYECQKSFREWIDN